MTSITIYNQAGKEQGKAELPKEITDVTVKQEVLIDVVQAYLAAARQGTVKTKDRSERRGGGKKPWKQKGTGRARHGSSRSPIWRKGGVTFGPTSERNFTKKINKKVRTKAVAMAINAKLADSEIHGIDSLEIKDAKTKQVADMAGALPRKGKSALIVAASDNPELVRAAKNIPGTDTTTAAQVNAYDLLSHDDIIVEKEAISVIAKRFDTKK